MLHWITFHINNFIVTLGESFIVFIFAVDFYVSSDFNLTGITVADCVCLDR